MSEFQTCPSPRTPAGVARQFQLKQSACTAVPPLSQAYKDMVDANLQGNKLATKRIKAVFQKNAIWPQKTTLNILFKDGEQWQRSWVEKNVMEKLQPLISLTFNFMNTFPNETRPRVGPHLDILISFANPGAYSMVGTESRQFIVQRPGEASMNLGWLDAPKPGQSFSYKGISYTIPSDYDKRTFGFTNGATVIHEFCHALGMLHEHQNPRGKTIEWNKNAVWNSFCGPPNSWDWQTIRTNVLDPLEIGTTNGSEFDPDSIMIYGFPGTMTLNMPEGTHMNSELSALDKEWLMKMYPTTEPFEMMKQDRSCIILLAIFLVLLFVNKTL
jgi:hypothetical protein